MTGDVTRGILTVTVTKIYLYNFIKLIWFFCITRSTQGLINERNKSMLHIELFISFDGNIYID